MGKVDKDHTISPDDLLQAHTHEVMTDPSAKPSRKTQAFLCDWSLGVKKRARELPKGTFPKMPWDK